MEGVLVEIEQDEGVKRRPTEVCLADEEGVEFDLIMWEDIKEGEKAREFSWLGEGALGGYVTRGVQTEPMLGAEGFGDFARDFPSLGQGQGTQPEPLPPGCSGRVYDPLEWIVSVYPRNFLGGRKVIRPGPEFQQKPLEGDWARHPCCGTVCAVRSAPLRPMTDRERFGPAPW